jgi:hypothetical protein
MILGVATTVLSFALVGSTVFAHANAAPENACMISVTKKVSDPTPAPGEMLTYTIKVTNNFDTVAPVPENTEEDETATADVTEDVTEATTLNAEAAETDAAGVFEKNGYDFTGHDGCTGMIHVTDTLPAGLIGTGLDASYPAADKLLTHTYMLTATVPGATPCGTSYLNTATATGYDAEHHLMIREAQAGSKVRHNKTTVSDSASVTTTACPMPTPMPTPTQSTTTTTTTATVNTPSNGTTPGMPATGHPAD